jgi:hypothetical protein
VTCQGWGRSVGLTRRPCLSVQATGTTSQRLELCVLQKGLVLLAIWLHSQSSLWSLELPAELVSAAPPGAYCALFWPPPGLLQTIAAVEMRPSVSMLLRRWWRHLVQPSITAKVRPSYGQGHKLLPNRGGSLPSGEAADDSTGALLYVVLRMSSCDCSLPNSG